MQTIPVIEVAHLSKAYGGAAVLEDISFKVWQGEMVGLVGPNGAGKTTLLETIEGLRRIQSGTVTVLGRSLADDPKAIQQEIGIQLQRTSLMGDITLKETLRLYKTLYKVKTDVHVLLDKVDLADMSHKRVRHLSGGQYQRFNLCLAILNKPKILFLDEPTTGLDPIARRKLWSIIEELKAAGVTILITTHYLEEAQELCDKILILCDHKIAAYDTPDNLIKELNNEKAIVIDGLNDLTEYELIELHDRWKVKTVDGQYFLYTYELGSALNEFFHWIKTRGKKVHNISVRSSSLEDVFMMYTSSGINQEGGAA
ncbi:MAG: ABC transporter ATP-binding protein [Chitinophagaceae bacterium]|nr:ABC transporter ATP-binding protein [Chitinophagaceae bacterium]